MNITLLVITDGRRECMELTMAAAEELLDGTINRVLIVNDSADHDYAEWLDAMYPSADRIHHPVRRGFGGAIQSGWDNLGDTDWVFHLEDDFVLERPVKLLDMVATLAGQPHLVQMALRRQAWNDEERAAGGIIERYPAEYAAKAGTRSCWLEHRLFFTTNPSLYPRSLARLGWPTGEQSEGRFSIRLLREGMPGVEPAALRFAFWGARTDPPLVHHIGNERVGTGY